MKFKTILNVTDAVIALTSPTGAVLVVAGRTRQLVKARKASK